MATVTPTLTQSLTHTHTHTHTHIQDHKPPREDHKVYEHIVGRGILHRAQHMHGALPITSGQRYNLIVWMRSSSVRNRLCPMCDQSPDLVPNTGYGDGFTTEDREQDVVQACGVF